jgi:hypothetical protein
MYRSKSAVLALCVSTLAFLSSYYYCYLTFGVLFTYCFGWLPSWVAAYAVSVVTRRLWSVAAAGLVRTRSLILIALASVISDHT